MSVERVRVFVYGTLKQGGYYYPRIESLVRGYYPGTIRGELVDVGWYPALVPGEGIVRGVLLELDPPGLSITDQIECYDPGNNSGEYLRKQVRVFLTAATAEGPVHYEQEAWTYEFAEPARLAQCPRLLVGHAQGTAVYEWSVRSPIAHRARRRDRHLR